MAPEAAVVVPAVATVGPEEMALLARAAAEAVLVALLPVLSAQTAGTPHPQVLERAAAAAVAEPTASPGR
jgi:hypothetical protein